MIFDYILQTVTFNECYLYMMVFLYFKCQFLNLNHGCDIIYHQLLLCLFSIFYNTKLAILHINSISVN